MQGLRALKQRMLGYLRHMLQGQPDPPAVRGVFPRLYDSQLETRRVLNADPTALATDALALVLSAGTDANDGRTDRFDIAQVSQPAGQTNGRQEIAVSINDQRVWQGSADQFAHVRLQGSSDRDVFTIDANITFVGVLAIDGGSHAQDTASDELIIMPGSDQSLRSITMEDRAGSVQIQFDPAQPFSNDQANAPGRAVWEVTHVGHIVDYAHSLDRHILLSRQDNWSLTNSRDASGNALLQLASSSQRYEFVVPTETLNIRADAAGSSIIQTGTIELGAGSSFALDSGADGTTIVRGHISALGDDAKSGGTVIVTGRDVQLDNQAVIDVSGSRGGGVVLIGGDQAGANASIRNATSTSIASGARISADATLSGHGGRIVVYALDRTRIDNASNLSARGSGLTASGGFIETSGRRHLSIQGTPVVTSTSGQAGQWLIDPEAISIVTSVPAIPDPNISYITVTDLLTMLNAGGDVILQTATVNPALGDIVIDANITATPAVSARLILQAARDIVFNGSITGNANLGLHLEATRDVNASTVSITGVDYVKAQSGGDTRFNTVSVGAATANAGLGLRVDASAAIRLAGNVTSSASSITLNGTTILANDVVLTTHGNSSALTLGNVDTGGSSRNLQLSSDGNISVGGIDLHGGTLTTQVDANNDGTATFSTSAELKAGSLQINGSAAKDDAVIAQGKLTSTTAAIALSNWNLVQLFAQSSSSTSFTASNVNTLELKAGGNITSAGAVNLDSTVGGILLSGASGSQNQITATGVNAAINLAAVTSTNSNVDLQITSDRSAAMKSITLTGGQVDVLYSVSNAANDSTASFTTVTSNGLSVTGANRTNDAVTIGSTLTLGAADFSITQVASVQLQGAVTTTTGNILLTTSSAATLASNLTTSGGSITINGATKLAGNVVITKQGNAGSLALGSVDTVLLAARNLSLVSDNGITLGTTDLHDGTLSIQVDANNDGVASFSATGDLTAGSLSINGSAAKNDSLVAQGNLKSTVGAILLQNFGQAQLAADSTSQTDFTATNVTSVELGSGADITAAGAIGLDATVGGILLSGGSSTQNQLRATGSNAAINLGPVTSTNNNVDLSLTSDRGVALKSITLTGGQVDVLFSQNNAANNSTASFTAAVNSDGLSVTGASRTNDAVTFSSPLTLGTTGLSVSQVATVQVPAAVTTTSGNINITASNATTLSANLTTSGGGSITLGGPTLLASNIVLTTQGNSGVLTVGRVTASGGARDLQLISDGDISTTGDMDLLGGTLIVQVDANNDGIASFSNTGDLTAGVLQINGSAAKNDTLVSQGQLKSTVGSILLKNFGQAQLNGDSISQTDFTATDVTSVRLGSGADITAAGFISLDATVGGIVLSGSSGTQNQLVSTGPTAAINLGPVTSTNNNVDLSLTSDRSVTLKSITLTGGQVDVVFSQNSAGASTASFTAAVTSDGLSVTGAGRINDGVVFSGPVTLATLGLSVTSVANTQVMGSVTSTTGGIVIASSNTTTLASNLITSGGNITLSGARMIVEGSSARTIASGGSGGTAVTAGNINLSGLGVIDGISAPGDLTISARGATNGGTVSLGNIANTLLGLRNLTVDTRGSGSSTTGQLVLNNGIAGSTSIVVSGNLSFINAKTRLTDDVVLTTLEETSTLSLGEVTTDAARSLQLSSESNIALSGLINLQGGALTAQVDSNNNSVSSLTSSADVTAGSIQISGSAAKNDTLAVQGLISTAGAVALNNFNTVQLFGDSSSATNFTATNVNTLELKSGADIASSGAINLDSTVGGVLLGGSSGTQNQLRATGSNAAINLGPVTSTNNNVDLSLTSDRGVALKSITLTGGQVDVLFSQNNAANNSTASFTAAVNSDGLSVTGASRTNDAVVFSSPLTLGTTGLSVSQVATVQFNANVNSIGRIAVNQVSNRVQLVQNGRLVSGGDIDLRTGVALLELVGGPGTLNQIVSSGDSATIQLASTSAPSGANLDVLSNHNIVLGNIDLTAAGRLQVEADRNNNNVGSTVTAGNLRAASITLLGSTNQNDFASLSGTIQSLSGDVTVRQFETVTLNGDTSSAGAVTVADVAQQLRLGFGVDMLAGNGDLTLLPLQIVFVGAIGSSHTLDARGAMNLAPLSSTNNIGVFLLANGDVQLAGAALPGNLVITSGNNGSLTGRIESSQRLSASLLDLSSASGVGTVTQLLTSANTISASARVSGDIRIANQAASTLVSSLSTVAGGNILFRQFGGPASFVTVRTTADATPTAGENQIALEVTGADLNLVASPLLSDGVGAIRLQTLTSGNVTVESDVRAPNSDVTLSSVQNILGNGITNGKSVRLEAVQAIGGPTGLQTQTTQLSTQTIVGATNVVNSSLGALNVTGMQSLVGGAIRLVQTGGGDVVVGNVITGSVSISGPSTIALLNSAGSLVIDGQVSAGGEGALDLQAQKNLLLNSTSQLKTNSDIALIEAAAAGQIQFQPGAVVRAGTGTPSTEAVVTQLPPLVQVIAVINSIGVNVDTDGIGVIDILLLPSGTGVLDQNYDVTINWGGGAIDRLPLGPTDVNTIPTGVVRFDASPTAYRVSHQYLQNPNTSDPSANIPVRVTAQVDALNRIRFIDSQGIAQRLSASSDTALVVPSTGLISLYFTLPQTPTIQKQLAFARDNTELPVARAFASERSELPVSTSSTSSVQTQRKIVLRVMIPVDEFGRVEASKDSGEDVTLTPEDVADLDALFSRLSDNRYRIYIIMEDGNEILLKDILLRNHQPAEIEDASNIRELDRTNIPLLDDVKPAPAATPSELQERSAINQANQRIDSPDESSQSVFRSWRKAARRFRAG